MNQLIDESEPHGEIKFIHSDGSERVFYTAVNSLSGDRLTAFDSFPPSINDSMAWIKSVFRDIRAKAKVLSYEGSKHFEK